MSNKDNNKSGVVPDEKQLTSEEEKKLRAFSISELEKLTESVAKALQYKKDEERRDLIDLIIETAKKANVGVDIYDLDSRKKELPIQYRNTDNPLETWRGRGIMPRWLQAKINDGYNKEDFKI
jgi:DNA-binding protein H-NS